MIIHPLILSSSILCELGILGGEDFKVIKQVSGCLNSREITVDWGPGIETIDYSNLYGHDLGREIFNPQGWRVGKGYVYEVYYPVALGESQNVGEFVNRVLTDTTGGVVSNDPGLRGQLEDIFFQGLARASVLRQRR